MAVSVTACVTWLTQFLVETCRDLNTYDGVYLNATKNYCLIILFKVLDTAQLECTTLDRHVPRFLLVRVDTLVFCSFRKSLADSLSLAFSLACFSSGYYNPAAGSNIYYACPAGSYSAAGQSACSLSPVATYMPLAASNTYWSCSISNLYGAQTCNTGSFRLRKAVKPQTT